MAFVWTDPEITTERLQLLTGGSAGAFAFRAMGRGFETAHWSESLPDYILLVPLATER
jgi:hypothetical protein